MLVGYAFSSVVDESIANVTTALKSRGMWENTLLVVSADNGGPAFCDSHQASNYPLRGGKHSFFEGGVRVAAFVSGGLLPASMRGKNISSPIHIADWFSTFAGLAGVVATDDHAGVPALDSIDQWPAQPKSRALVLATRTLNAKAQSRVTLSLREEHLRAACYTRLEERGPEIRPKRFSQANHQRRSGSEHASTQRNIHWCRCADSGGGGRPASLEADCDVRHTDGCRQLAVLGATLSRGQGQ